MKTTKLLFVSAMAAIMMFAVNYDVSAQEKTKELSATEMAAKEIYYKKINTSLFSALNNAEQYEKYELMIWVLDNMYLDTDNTIKNKLTKNDYEKKGLPMYLFEDQVVSLETLNSKQEYIDRFIQFITTDGEGSWKSERSRMVAEMQKLKMGIDAANKETAEKAK